MNTPPATREPRTLRMIRRDIEVVSTAAILYDGRSVMEMRNKCWTNLPCDDGLDGVTITSGLHDKPKEHVNHVYTPDGLKVEINVTTISADDLRTPYRLRPSRSINFQGLKGLR